MQFHSSLLSPILLPLLFFFFLFYSFSSFTSVVLTVILLTLSSFLACSFSLPFYLAFLHHSSSFLPLLFFLPSFFSFFTSVSLDALLILSSLLFFLPSLSSRIPEPLLFSLPSSPFYPSFRPFQFSTFLPFFRFYFRPFISSPFQCLSHPIPRYLFLLYHLLSLW